jgi:hypothetical protein
VWTVSIYFFSGQKVSGSLQMSHARLGFFKSERNQNLALRDETGSPEVTCHFNFMKGNGLDIGLSKDWEGTKR